MVEELNFDGFRRQHERKDYDSEIYFSVDKIAYRAEIKNLSRGGALIRHGGLPAMKLGDEIIITIPFTDKKRNVKRNARVVWSGESEFGIEFV